MSFSTHDDCTIVFRRGAERGSRGRARSRESGDGAREHQPIVVLFEKKLPRTFFDLVFFVARSGLVLWTKIHLTAKGLSICDKFTSAITGANFVC